MDRFLDPHLPSNPGGFEDHPMVGQDTQQWAMEVTGGCS